MGGLFSGLGRSGKKAEPEAAKDAVKTAPQKQEPAKGQAAVEPKDQKTKSAEGKPTVKPPTKEATPKIPAPATKDLTEKSIRSNEDRSQTMRLSKNTPSKPEEDFDIPSETVIPSFPGGSNKTTSEVRSLGPTAVIGPKIKFKGELSGEEDLIIEGTVEGTIELKDNQLTIGKQGTVHANVSAKSITIEGKVEGDLTAVERINIKSSSEVLGNVTAERVMLEDGAKFRGSIDMDTSRPNTTPKASAPSSKGTTPSSSTSETEKA